MAPGELNEFDEYAREALLLLKDARKQTIRAEAKVLWLMNSLEVGDGDPAKLLLGEALDKVDEGFNGALEVLTVIAGRKALADLVAPELEEFEAAKGPRDVRDKPTPGS